MRRLNARQADIKDENIARWYYHSVLYTTNVIIDAIEATEYGDQRVADLDRCWKAYTNRNWQRQFYPGISSNHVHKYTVAK